jgi:hypothetical protein
MARRAAFASILVSSLLVAASLLAADQAKGTYHFGQTRFAVTDALYYQKETADPMKPLDVVMLTDFTIDRQNVIDAIDGPSALAGQVNRSEKGNFVVLTFPGDKECHVFALLGATQQQIEVSGVLDAKKNAANHISGTCRTDGPQKMFDDEYDFLLSYDLPLTPIPKPTKLGAGGGDPGAALVAVVKAIQANDWKVAQLHVRQGEVPETAPKGEELKSWFESLALNYPKSAAVTGGLMKGNVALLDITGTDREGKKIHGQFSMQKVGDDWRVVEQSLYFAE